MLYMHLKRIFKGSGPLLKEILTADLQLRYLSFYKNLLSKHSHPKGFQDMSYKTDSKHVLPPIVFPVEKKQGTLNPDLTTVDLRKQEFVPALCCI